MTSLGQATLADTQILSRPPTMPCRRPSNRSVPPTPHCRRLRRSDASLAAPPMSWVSPAAAAGCPTSGPAAPAGCFPFCEEPQPASHAKLAPSKVRTAEELAPGMGKNECLSRHQGPIPAALVFHCRPSTRRVIYAPRASLGSRQTRLAPSRSCARSHPPYGPRRRASSSKGSARIGKVGLDLENASKRLHRRVQPIRDA